MKIHQLYIGFFAWKNNPGSVLFHLFDHVSDITLSGKTLQIEKIFRKHKPA